MDNALEVRIEQKIGVLNWNFTELNRAVEDGLKKYKNIVITEDQIDDARKMRADLNNVKKLLDRRRIDAGKEFCQPYEDFKGQVKTVTTKIDECVKEIDDQIKYFEEQEKKAKYERMEKWFYEMCKTSPQIAFERVFDKKYLNKTCKDAEWQVSLEGKYGVAKKDLEAIAGIEPEAKRDYVLAEYMKSLDLGDALTRYGAYEKQLRDAEEYRRRAAEEAAKKAANVPPQPEAATAQLQKPETQTNTRPVEETPQILLKRTMEVWGTREQIIALGNFMTQNGIKFRKVEA